MEITRYPFGALLAWTMLLLAGACSSDGGTTGDPALRLVGDWELSTAYFDEESSIDAVVAAQLFEELRGQNCPLLVFEFGEDGTGIAQSKLEFLDISADVGSFDVDCPQPTSVEAFLWTLEEDQLSVTDAEGVTSVVTLINSSKNAFEVAGEEVDPDTFSGSVAVFIRR